MNEVVPFGSTGLVPHNMDEALRLAEFMSRARTVPKHLQDSPGDCLMAIEQAMRWGMSPFAVAQATSIISGKLMFEGKLVAAAVETSGAIVGQLEYEFSGEGDARAVKVSGTRRGETNPRTITIVLKEARTNNEMWKRQPDQQLCYHGARVWARRWTPAVILGVYSREEMGPIIDSHAEDVTPRQAINTEVPLRAAAADMPRAPKVADPQVYEASQQNQKTEEVRQQPRTRGQFLDALSIALNDARSAEEMDRILCSEDVMRAKEAFTNGLKERLDGLISRALAKWWTDPPEDELPHIAGEELAGA
jgi:RecT family